MTGLSDSMRANFQLMKEMSHTTHADARKRVQECKSLLEMFQNNEKCKEEMEAWQMTIDSEPTQLTGTKIQAGNMVMGMRQNGGRVQFEVENTPDIDRKIQA